LGKRREMALLGVGSAFDGGDFGIWIFRREMRPLFKIWVRML